MKLKESQKQALLFILNHSRTLFRAPTGSGKTVVAISSIKILREKGFIKLPIVVGKPKELLAFKKPSNNIYGLQYQVIENSRDFSMWQVQNWEGKVLLVASTLITDFPAKFLEAVVKADFLVMDEVHNYRNFTNKTTNLIRRGIKYFKGRILGLTATPFYRSIENIFALMSLIQPNLFTSWQWFENEFIMYEDREIRVKNKVNSAAGLTKNVNWRTIKDKVGYKNTNVLMQMLEPYVFYTDDTKFTVTPRIQEYDISAERGERYNKAVKGIGLGTVVYQIHYWDYVKQREFEIGREHTEGVWNDTQTATILAPDLKAGMIFTLNGNACQVQWVKEVEAKADFFKRIIELQRLMLDSDEKFEELVKLVRDRGTLIYCNFLESADYVVTRLKQELPERRIAKLTGATDKDKLAMTVKSLQENDIAVITRAASQSLDFYFQQVILFEEITTPGLLEQFVGRCMRNDAKFDQVDLIFLMGRRTIEEYLYSRCRAETNQSPGAMFQNKLPAVEGYEGIENWDFRQLKDQLLWRPWTKTDVPVQEELY